MNIQEWLNAGKPWNVILLGDCMELMKHIDDKSINLSIVDPPYNIVSQQLRGIGSRIDSTGKMNLWNHQHPDKKYFNELFRISQSQIIWGANNYEGLPATEYFIIWNKCQTVNNFASAEYAWTNCKKPAKVFTYSIHKEMADRKLNGGKIHPTQKPIALYRWLLQNYAKPGDKIIDTHSGSGSCACACWLEKFDFLAIEKDADYHAASVKRFEELTAQGRLF